MDRFNLTKPQKKSCRELIEIALQRECAKFIDKLTKAIDNNRKKELSPHENYLDIYKKVRNFDKNLQWNYDNVTGSRYFMTVLNLYVRGILIDEDLKSVDEEIRNELIILKKSFKAPSHKK